MQIEGKDTVLTEHGNTSDIIKAVMMAYDIEDDVQIRELAERLRGKDDTESCRNVYDYLLKHIRYRADEGTQEIRTPARLVHDGVGDCKSYSVFTASVLRCLGIPHFFRFVSYDHRKEATHVYVVALINGTETPLDAVARIQAQVLFGNELKYAYRADMKDRTTRIAYLSGINDKAMIGAADETALGLPSAKMEMWLDSENEASLTLAKGYLLSEWDKNWVIYAVAHTAERQIEVLNELQYIGVMIALYNKYRASNEMLERLGCAMAYAVSAGVFDSNNPDAGSRDFFSEENMRLAEEYISGSDELPWFADFMEHWEKNVVEANHRYAGSYGQPMSIGATAAQRKSFRDMGGGYLYGYMTAKEANISLAVAQKRNTQIDMANWFSRNASSAILPAEQSNEIYSGCTATWNGEPADVIAELKAGKYAISGAPKVGVVDPVTIITTIATAVVKIIFGLISIFKKKDPAPSDSDINKMVPDPAKDGFTLKSGAGGGASSAGSGSVLSEAGMSWILPLALAGGLLIKKMSKKGTCTIQ